MASVACEACRATLVLGGRFVVLEPLAAHGSARTLGGIEHESGRAVVIKTLSLSGLIDWKQLELFQRGITVLRGLSHPGIPAHLGDGQLARGGETIYYWVQERVPGRTLAAGLADGQRWTEARARALADGLLQILEYLQSFSPPVLHRDLKPSNVIERPHDEGWSLIDFDLVKDTLDPEGGDTTALGTAGYASLEQLMGRAVPASDLYGLGATLVAVLSRKSPADLLDEDARRIEFRAHVRVSEAFAGFLDALLDPRVSQRPADATAARARLHEAVAGADAATVERQRLARARAELLGVLRAHATKVIAAPGLVTTDVHDAQIAQIAHVDTGRTALVAVAPSSKPVVILQSKLAEDHPVPWWLLPTRIGIVVAAAVAIPATGVVLAVLIAIVWIMTGLVVRYPVKLPPGRALFKGGHANSSAPGVHWLRRRWGEHAHSIPLAPLYLRWRPAPTRLEQGELHAWLELELELWVTPREDDLGEFFALLNYRAWQSTPQRAADKLREAVLDAIAEYVQEEGLLARATHSPICLDARVLTAIEHGLRELGLERLDIGKHSIMLRPRTDDLASEDRLWIALRAPGTR